MNRPFRFRMIFALGVAIAAAGCGGDNEFPDLVGVGDGNRLGVIRGQVTATGVGVGGARVIMVNRDSVLTNGQGLYEFTRVPAATYTIQLRVPANYTLPIGDSDRRQVTVTDGGVAEASWTLRQEIGSTNSSVPAGAVAPPIPPALQ